MTFYIYEPPPQLIRILSERSLHPDAITKAQILYILNIEGALPWLIQFVSGLVPDAEFYAKLNEVVADWSPEELEQWIENLSNVNIEETDALSEPGELEPLPDVEKQIKNSMIILKAVVRHLLNSTPKYSFITFHCDIRSLAQTVPLDVWKGFFNFIIKNDVTLEYSPILIHCLFLAPGGFDCLRFFLNRDLTFNLVLLDFVKALLENDCFFHEFLKNHPETLNIELFNIEQLFSLFTDPYSILYDSIDYFSDLLEAKSILEQSSTRVPLLQSHEHHPAGDSNKCFLRK